MTATIMNPDLTSDMPDLTGVLLDDLRDHGDPALLSALHDVYVEAEFNTGNERQDQRGGLAVDVARPGAVGVDDQVPTVLP